MPRKEREFATKVVLADGSFNEAGALCPGKRRGSSGSSPSTSRLQ